MCTVGVGGVGSPGSGDSATAIPLGVERDSSTSFSWESAAVMAFGYLSGESCWYPLSIRSLKSMPERFGASHHESCGEFVAVGMLQS